MAGLGNPGGGQTPQPQQPAQPMSPQGGMMDADQGPPATPEEEAALEQFREIMGEVLFPRNSPKQVFPQILEDLKGNMDRQALAMFEGVQPPLTNSPQDMVSATAVILTLIVDQKMGLLEQAMQQRDAPDNEQAEAAAAPGGQPPSEQDEAAAEEDKSPFDPGAVLFEGGKVAVETLIEVSEAARIHNFTPEETEGAYLRAVDLFRVAQTKVNPQLIQTLSADFARLVQADRAGQGSKVLPGLPGGPPMQQQAR